MDNLETQANHEWTLQRHRQHWTQETERKQSRDTGNTGHKKQSADNPETQATLDTRNRAQTIQRHRQHWTQETERRQSRDTGNTGHKKQNADKQNNNKQNQTNTTQKTKKMSNLGTRKV